MNKWCSYMCEISYENTFNSIFILFKIIENFMNKLAS